MRKRGGQSGIQWEVRHQNLTLTLILNLNPNFNPNVYILVKVLLHNIHIHTSNPNVNDVTKSAIGMQEDFRNCSKENPSPPSWHDAIPESFANALKMWEKEVR